MAPALPPHRRRQADTVGEQEGKPSSCGPQQGKRGAVLEAAMRAELPNPPDLTAEAQYLVAMAQAVDIEGPKVLPINPISSSLLAQNGHFRSMHSPCAFFPGILEPPAQPQRRTFTPAHPFIPSMKEQASRALRRTEAA